LGAKEVAAKAMRAQTEVSNNALQKLYKLWHKCGSARGIYFEGKVTYFCAKNQFRVLFEKVTVWCSYCAAGV
jgi:hypothetical protein